MLPNTKYIYKKHDVNKKSKHSTKIQQNCLDHRCIPKHYIFKICIICLSNNNIRIRWATNSCKMLLHDDTDDDRSQRILSTSVCYSKSSGQRKHFLTTGDTGREQANGARETPVVFIPTQFLLCMNRLSHVTNKGL
jgi:hypothetical protein